MATPVSWPPHQNRDASSTTSTMAPPHNIKRLQQEGRLAIATQTYKNNYISSIRRAATLYNIPKSTLTNRVKGATSQSTLNAKKRKL